MSGVMCLIALSLGYLVYLTAVKEKDGLRILGQVIGIVVMLASIGGFLCSTMHRMKGGMGGDCSMGSKMSCPMMAAKMDHKMETDKK